MAPHTSTAGRLEHARDAIDEIEVFTSARTLEDYLRDPLLRRAVERDIEIVSEASRNIPGDLKARHRHIPWREIAGIGNVLRHGYETVDDRELWRVVRRDLPPLKQTIETMLRDIEATERD